MLFDLLFDCLDIQCLLSVRKSVGFAGTLFNTLQSLVRSDVTMQFLPRLIKQRNAFEMVGVLLH